MRRNALVRLFAGLLAVSGTIHAGEPKPEGRQSFESCGLITGEYVTVLQLIARGVPPAALKQTLPDISKKAQERVDALVAMTERDGLIDSYSAINSEYASCARRVFNRDGVPAQGSREAHFHRCAGENKVGYEIAIAALVGAPKAEVSGQLRPEHRARATQIFNDLTSDGALTMFDGLATALKRCLAAMP